MEKIKRETTVVGDIAPNGHDGIGVTNDLDPKQTRKRDKKRREMNKQGKQLGQPKEFEQLADSAISKNVIERIVKNEMFDIIVEQGNPNQIMDLYDNVTKMLALSLQYARMFMVDGMKLGPDAIEFNYKRSKAELSRVSKLIRDIDQILLKVYSKHKQDVEQEMHAKEQEKMQQQQEPVQRVENLTTEAKRHNFWDDDQLEKMQKLFKRLAKEWSGLYSQKGNKDGGSFGPHPVPMLVFNVDGTRVKVQPYKNPKYKHNDDWPGGEGAGYTQLGQYKDWPNKVPMIDLTVDVGGKKKVVTVKFMQKFASVKDAIIKASGLKQSTDVECSNANPMIRKQLESKYIEIPVIKEGKKKLDEAWTGADDLAKAHSDAYELKHKKENERFRKEIADSKAKFLRKYKVKSNFDLTGDGAEDYRKNWLPKYDMMWKKHIEALRKADAENTNEANKTTPVVVKKGDVIFNRWGTARVTKLEPGNKVKIRWMTPVTAKGDTDIMSTDKLKDSGGSETFQNRRVNRWAVKGEM